MMIPRRYEPAVFGFVLSGLMSFLVSGISTVRIAGPRPGFVGLWCGSWLTAWLFAFPAVLLMAPIARRIVHSLIRQDGGRE